MMLLFVPSIIMSQGFTFQVQTGTYTDLTGSTSLNQNQIWDDPEYAVHPGFSFPFRGMTYDTLFVGDYVCALNAAFDTIIAPYMADLVDRGSLTSSSLSPISYKIETATTPHIFKLEFKNAGFFEEYDSYGTLDWYTNYQLWLYENGIWEVHIGPTFIADSLVAFMGEPGPSIGFGIITANYWLTGPAANPTLVLNTSPLTIPPLSSVPSDGTIYRFVPTSIGMEQTPVSTAFNLWPNPVVNELSMDLPFHGTVELFDLTGKRLMANSNMETGRQVMDLSSLTGGSYLVVYTSHKGEKTSKRIVKR